MAIIGNSLNLPASTANTSLTLGNGTTILTANILEVKGSAAFGTFAGTAAPSNGLIVSGTTGIGTSSPSATLHVSRSSAATSGTASYLQVDQVADTSQTASTESSTVLFSFDAANRTWATGALTLQRYFKVNQPTIAFAGASTVTDVTSVGIVGAPAKGTNATVTNTHALLIGQSTVGTATNSYGLTVNAQTGATNNYCAQFIGGSIGIGTASPNTSALLAMSSTTQGLLPPSMTTTQKNAISTPASGLTLYDSSLKELQYYDGTAWVSPGAIIQVLSAIKVNTFTTTATLSGGGAAITGLSVTITPRSSSSTFLIMSHFTGNSNLGKMLGIWIANGSTKLNTGTPSGSRLGVGTRAFVSQADSDQSGCVIATDSPASASAQTYNLFMCGEDGNTAFLNQTPNDTNNNSYGARSASSIVVYEIAG